MLSPDYSKRSYLLPKGCKDLIDVIHLQELGKIYSPQPPGQPPLLKLELLVSQPISVAALADLLNQKPFQIMADLLELGVFPTTKQLLDFETVCRVARKYGYAVKRRG